MAEKEKQEKKIIIDDDWKAQAQKEKEILAAKAEAEAEDKAEAQTETGQRPPLPAGDLTALVSMLTTQAFLALGVIRMKEGEEQPTDLKMAKFHIDLLETLQEKTKGNLTDAEAKMLEDTLYQLQMTFVKVSE